jgi:predicted Zn-dependent protease
VFDSQVGMARMLVELGDHATAIIVCGELLKTDDEYTDIWLFLAMSHDAIGDKGAAIECIRRAHEVSTPRSMRINQASSHQKKRASTKVSQQELESTTNDLALQTKRTLLPPNAPDSVAWTM